jgi:uncharacterized protein VirK/YbjX
MRSAARVYATHGLGKTRFFVTKYLQFYPLSERWICFIDQFCEHHTGAQAPVEMIRTKFMRRFYSKTVAAKGRLDLLQSHYSVLETYLRSGFIAQLMAGQSLDLAVISGKSGEAYRFTVAQHERFRYEGDLTIFMHRASDDQMLAALTFNLGFTPRHDVVMRIGGLQGPLAEDAKQTIIEVTRDLNGLRPKAAVLDLFYGLARAFQAVRIEAVAIRNHPLNKEGRGLVANNDTFWEECGATLVADGNFVLPLKLERKAFEDVAPKKRKDWLARQGLKGALEAQAIAAVRGWMRFSQIEDADASLMMAAE